MKLTEKLYARFERNVRDVRKALDQGYEIAGMWEAANAGEEWMMQEVNWPLLRALCKKRGDGIDSSAEQAALGFALDELGLLD